MSSIALIALTMQSSSRVLTFTKRSDRTNQLKIKSTEPKLQAMTLKKALLRRFYFDDLSVLSVLFNDDLLSVVPKGVLGNDTLDTLGALSRNTRDCLINFETLTLNLSIYRLKNL